MKRKVLAVNGDVFEMFILKTRKGYRMSAVTTDKHPYRIIRDKIFTDNPTEKQIEEWAINALQTIKN
jgi:hypothetical protein